jgi:hypothetical protein
MPNLEFCFGLLNMSAEKKLFPVSFDSEGAKLAEMLHSGNVC